MRILVLSDSHFASLENIAFEKYDAVIHCGDYGDNFLTLKKHHVYFVKGNCDFYGEEFLLLDLFGKKVFVTHGHKENVKYKMDTLLYKSLENEVKLTFFGHTHDQTYYFEEGILFLNPGSFPNAYVEITEDTLIFYKDGTVNKIFYRW